MFRLGAGCRIPGGGGAAQRGRVCSTGLCGTTALEPLVNSSAGALYLYPSAEQATLPRDFKGVSSSSAGVWGGVEAGQGCAGSLPTHRRVQH
jgi:hypothetical protein